MHHISFISTRGKDIPLPCFIVSHSSRLSSIVLSHFLLDLRSVYLKSGQIPRGQSLVSSIVFSESVFANIGAALNGFGDEGPDEEDSEGSRVVYSEQPLAVGLLELDLHDSFSEEELGSSDIA